MERRAAISFLVDAGIDDRCANERMQVRVQLSNWQHLPGNVFATLAVSALDTKRDSATGARLLAWYFVVSVPVGSSLATTSPVTTFTRVTA